jgi:transcriptional regulator with XRE-family HTH domain
LSDELIDMLNDIMKLTDDKQAKLGKRFGVAQSTIHRWLNGISRPSVDERAKVRALWRKLKGIESLDDKIAPYDEDTKALIHKMVDNYLTLLLPKR